MALADVARSQALAMAAAIRECPPTAASYQLEDCHLLSPAYTGSGFTRKVLSKFVHLPVSRHSTTLQTVRQQNLSASCFIMTLRDPLERIESGVRYRIMTNATWNSTSTDIASSRNVYKYARQLPTADLLVAAWQDSQHPLHAKVPQLALSSNPPRMQADMIRGHACGSTALRVLCTSSLEEELSRLAAEFGRQLPIKTNAPRPRSPDANVHSLALRRWFSCHSVAAEDTWLHYEMCTRAGGARPPCTSG